ncbi:MAG: Stp1/IreP family PP2C-type Ser/Thr phosphatase [Rubrobacteraceae bacterium]
MLYLEPFGATHAGKVRANNEDALLVGEGRDETLFVVADGIGGFEAGEVASRIAVDVLKELEPGASFEAAIGEANRRILAAGRGDERLSGMGTTVVAVRFAGTRDEPVAQVAHVGDSRAYLLRGGNLRPVTEDHSLVAELVRSGDLTRDQAAEHPQKNLITRALGADEEVEVDTSVLPVEAGDRFLLCSDGLSDMIPETRIGEILAEAPGDPEKPARSLVSAALDAGGADNVTVIVVDVKAETAPQEERSGDTHEMPPVARSGDQAATRAPAKRSSRKEREPRAEARSRPSRQTKAARRKRRRSRFGSFVRGLAAVLVLVVALTPAYLWGSSRYFLSLDEGEVVAYRGLPYAPLGVELNGEWRRTDVEWWEVKTPYQGPIENHKLYTKGEIEQVLQDLGK